MPTSAHQRIILGRVVICNTPFYHLENKFLPFVKPLLFDENPQYKLWIYGKDNAGNYALIKLDNDFYIDSLAPRMEKTIEGNPNVYSNNVSNYIF